MKSEISKEQRQEAIRSIQAYFERNMPEPVGDLAAGLLLDFFLVEIGPLVYNQAIADAQTTIQSRIAELDGDLHEPPFTFWLKPGKRSR